MVFAPGWKSNGAKLASGGGWLNASKSEAGLEATRELAGGERKEGYGERKGSCEPDGCSGTDVKKRTCEKNRMQTT